MLTVSALDLPCHSGVVARAAAPSYHIKLVLDSTIADKVSK
jgi:hypothetical protein